MRNVLSVSLPDDLLTDLARQAKENKYPTISEYVRHLIRLHNTEKLAREIQLSRAEMLAGKGKLLKSLKDLR